MTTEARPHMHIDESVDAKTLTAISVLYFILGSASFFALTKGLGSPDYITSASLFAGVICSTYFVYNLSNKKQTITTMIATSFLIAGSFFISNLLFDFSPDGTGYHQDAILALTKDFDFLRSSLRAPSSLGGGFPIYTNSYPKLSWFYSASVYDLTGNIHYGKSINFLLISAAWLSAYSALSQIRIINRTIFATALAANPITVSQLFSHYVDGALGAFLTISIIGLFGFFWSKRTIDFLVLSTAGMIGCASLKHTGFVFSSLVALQTLYMYIKIRRISIRSIAIPRIYVPILIISLLLTINPYVKNLVEGKHIFYPSMGTERVETLISGQTTKQFFELDQISKLLMSAFGRTENEDPKLSPPFPTIKIPFTITKSEMRYSEGVDVRWGGWGPLFGGVLLVTILYLLMRNHKIYQYTALITLLAILSIISPESWWARLNPQLYTFTAISLIIFYINDEKSRWTVRLMLAILIFNSVIILNSATKNVLHGDRYISEVINEISENGSKKVCWDIKRTHLEPIFDRLGVTWNEEKNCPVENSICKEILGEKICRFQTSG